MGCLQHSSTSNVNQDEDDTSTLSQHSTSSTDTLCQPPQHNPYHSEPPLTLPNWVMTHLRSWILLNCAPVPQPPILNHPPTMDHPTEILVLPTATTDLPTHLQTLITNHITNQHWGDQMQCPKPFNIFWVLSQECKYHVKCNRLLILESCCSCHRHQQGRCHCLSRN